MAAWFCWFLNHKWIEALDPELEQCDRCDKLRRKQKRLPRGTLTCPYPDCGHWVAPPPHKIIREGQPSYIFRKDSSCSGCKRAIRWQKDHEDWAANYGKKPWPPPLAIEENND